METKKQGTHNLSLENRKKLEMSGVEEVITFNETKILLQTNQGTLNIQGKELNIQQLNLDNSQIRINGYVHSLEYSNKSTEKNIFKRLFK